MQPAEIRAFFDEPTNTVSYLVWDPATREGAMIDPVLDWDNRSGTADTAFADSILAAAKEEGVAIRYVLETHAHADHLTAAPYIAARTGARIGIGEHIKEVQRIFRPVFDAQDLKPEGGDFDLLFRDGERFPLGSLEVEVMHVPGHTPADIAYRIGDDVFVGDTLFMHDYGTARAISRAVTRASSTARSGVFWPCRRPHASGCAMTTKRRAATPMPGRARWRNSAPITRM